MANDALEGNTLNVYAYVAKEDKPVGTREVTRGASLSSPSVAFRHLQKLEALGLIERNVYGNYTLKQKTDVSGYIWVGRTLMPRLMFYAFFFMGAFAAEIVISAFSFLVLGLAIEASFFFLTAMTAVAMILFLTEGIRLYRRVQRNAQTNP
ncbi:MAG: hypothetical protein NWF05_10015 [Candidatus Bathyarchaeota archaeon]|nr:hypothetical protein [Candidatus Bathyarchaeota archaeon]